jgi:hypothetical protein
VLNSQVFGRGEIIAIPLPNIGSMGGASEPLRRRHSGKGRAVPGRRPSIRVGLGSLRSTHFAGDRSRVRCRRGNRRVVRLKPIRGAQDGLSTANATDVARAARADFPAPRGSRVRPRHRARLSACLAARARFLAGRSRGLFARDRQQHFPLPFDALAAFLGLCRRGALRLHAATQRLH